MGLTMSKRRAVTKTIATRYKRADKTAKHPGSGGDSGYWIPTPAGSARWSA